MNPVVKVGAIALQGLHGAKVLVEAAVTRQLPGIGIVGLPDTALNESKHRIRYAIEALGLHLSSRYVLINLQPAELPKHGSGFDLAIALAALVVSGTTHVSSLETTAHIGELSLDGRCIRPRGLLPSVLAAKQAGFRRVMVPAEGVAEASLVRGIAVIGVDTLESAVNWYQGTTGGWSDSSDTSHNGAVVEQPNTHEPASVEVMGQQQALDALVIAAAGGHHLMLEGPPGAGKTLLAQTLPRLLPPLTREEALTVTSLRSLTDIEPVTDLCTLPPFEQPHHTATIASMVGSSRGHQVHPGSVSLASSGVLFLDEVPHFSTTVLDALRQPLESGTVTLHRATMRVTLPAAMQLVLAQNPCPCGKAGGTLDDAACTCSSLQIRRYQSRLSGPLQDRIDLHLRIPRVHSARAEAHDGYDASLGILQERVIAARSRAAHRLRATPWLSNAQVPTQMLLQGQMSVPASDTEVLDRALALGTITLRGYVRALRVAWSIADVEGATRPGRTHIAQALVMKEPGFV